VTLQVTAGAVTWEPTWDEPPGMTSDLTRFG
jgi:hypothetical protein